MTQLSGKRIHCIGIGGIGVSALAEIAITQGARISGSDIHENAQTERLRRLGAEIHIGHSAEWVNHPDLAVYSSAIRTDNPERKAAEAVCRTIRRGTFLAELMRGKRGVGICGAHGKSTTSCLTAQLLEHCGAGPTVCLGAVPAGRPTQAWPGSGDVFVSELDESDGSFLEAPVRVGVVTNIDADHLDYYGTMENIESAFRTFVTQLPADGALVLGADNTGAQKLREHAPCPVITTGLAPEADLTVRDLHIAGLAQRFRLRLRGQDLGEFQLPLPGVHNVRNALCALGAALSMGFDPDTLRAALATAGPVERRFEIVGERAGITAIDDYAHHPTEIAATLQTARACHAGRIVAVFQPHLYSRTQFLAEAFARSLALADVVMLADIYPAREAPIPGVTSELVTRALSKHGRPTLGPHPRAQIVPRLRTAVHRGDLVVFIGAGDIGACAREFLDTLPA